MTNGGPRKLAQQDQLALVRKEIEMLIKKRQDHTLRESQMPPQKLGVGKLMVQKYQDFLKISRLIEEKLARATDASFDAIAENIRDLIIKLFEKYRDINPAFFAKKKVYYLARIKQKMAELLQLSKRKLLLNTKVGKIKYSNDKESAMLKQLIDEAELCLVEFDAKRFERMSKRVFDNMTVFTPQEKRELLKIFEAMRPDVHEYKEAQRRKTLGEDLFEELSNARPLKFKAARAIQLLKQNLLLEDGELEARIKSHTLPMNSQRDITLAIEKKNNRLLMIDNYDDVIGMINKTQHSFRNYSRSKDINAREIDQERVNQLLKKIDNSSKQLLDKGLIKREKSNSTNVKRETHHSRSKNSASTHDKGKFFNNFGNRARNLTNFIEDVDQNDDHSLSMTLSKKNAKISIVRRLLNGDAINMEDTLRKDSRQNNIRLSNQEVSMGDIKGVDPESGNVFYNYDVEMTSDDEYIESKKSVKVNVKSRANPKKPKKPSMAKKHSEPVLFHDDLFEIKSAKFDRNSHDRKGSVPVFEELDDNSRRNSETISEFHKYLYSLTDEQLMQIHMLMENYKDNPVLESILNNNNLNAHQKFMSLLQASVDFQRFPSIQGMQPRLSEMLPNKGFCFNADKRPIVMVKDQVHKDCYSFLCKVKGQEDICPQGYANSKVLDYNGDVINLRTKEILSKGGKSVTSNEPKVKNKGKLVGLTEDPKKFDKGLTRMLRNDEVYDLLLGEKRMKSASYDKKVLKVHDRDVRPVIEPEVIQENITKISEKKIDNTQGKNKLTLKTVSWQVEAARNSRKNSKNRQNEVGRNSRKSSRKRRSSSRRRASPNDSEEIPSLTNTNYFADHDDTKRSSTIHQTDPDIRKQTTTTENNSLKAHLISESSKNYAYNEAPRNLQVQPEPKVSKKPNLYQDPIIEISRASLTDKYGLSELNIHENKNDTKSKKTNNLAPSENGTDYFDLMGVSVSKVNTISGISQSNMTDRNYAGKMSKDSNIIDLNPNLSDIKLKADSNKKSIRVSDRMLKAYNNKITESLSNKESIPSNTNRSSKVTNPSSLNAISKNGTSVRIQSQNQPTIPQTKKSGTFDVVDQSQQTETNSQDMTSYDLLDDSHNSYKKPSKNSDLIMIDYNEPIVKSNSQSEARKSTVKPKQSININRNSAIAQVKGNDIKGKALLLEKVEKNESNNTNGTYNMLGDEIRITNVTQPISKSANSNYFDLDSVTNNSRPSNKSSSHTNSKKAKVNEVQPESRFTNKVVRQTTSESGDNIEFKNDKKILKITTISTPLSGLMDEHHGDDAISEEKSRDGKSSEISNYFDNL